MAWKAQLWTDQRLSRRQRHPLGQVVLFLVLFVIFTYDCVVNLLFMPVRLRAYVKYSVSSHILSVFHHYLTPRSSRWTTARWTTASRFSLVWSPASCKTGCSPSWIPPPVWFSARRSERITPLLRELHWLRVPERVTFRLSVLAYRCLHGTAPVYLAESLLRTPNVDTRRRQRSADSAVLVVPSTRRSTIGDRAFPVTSACAWNSLPSSVRNAPSLTTFRRELKICTFPVVVWQWLGDRDCTA